MAGTTSLTQDNSRVWVVNHKVPCAEEPNPDSRTVHVLDTNNGHIIDSDSTHNIDTLSAVAVTQHTTQPKYWKIAVTTNMTFSMIAMGMFLEISGPTLPYLKDRIGVDYEEVSRALVARSIGYFISSLFGGFLCDAFPRFSYVYFSCCYLMAAIGTGMAPWCRTLVLLSAMLFLQGIGQGCICTGLNSVVMKMWGNKGGPALISQHLGFGIGALIAPQLANAFIWRTPVISNPNQTTTNSTSIWSTTVADLDLTDTPATTVKEQIEYPYMIIAVLCLLFSVAFLFVYLMELLYTPLRVTNKADVLKAEKKSLLEKLKLLSPATCTGGDTLFGMVFFLLIAVVFIHIVGGERAISKFIYSFALESSHQLTTQGASLLNSAFWFSFTAGRAVNTAAAIFYSPNILILIEVIFNIINGSVLAIWGTTNTTVLWVFTCSYGFFLSPLFPTALVWANLYVEMTAMGMAVGYVGSAIGGMIYQWLTGYLFQYHGPATLMYVILGCTLNLGLVCAILQVLSSRHGNRFKIHPQEGRINEQSDG